MRSLVRIDILGLQCVPWSVPEVGVDRRGGGRNRFTTRNPKLEAWQAYVKQEARKAMSRLGIVLGPVRLSLIFYRKTPKGHRHGELWAIPVEWSEAKEKYVKKGVSSPDITNLIKGTEDALEGVIFGNDAQSCLISSSRLYGPLDGVTVQVWEIEPGDFPGIGDPVGGDQSEESGEVSGPARVRRTADRTTDKQRGGRGGSKRKNPVSVAVPRAGGDEVPGDPQAP